MPKCRCKPSCQIRWCLKFTVNDFSSPSEPFTVKVASQHPCHCTGVFWREAVWYRATIRSEILEGSDTLRCQNIPEGSRIPMALAALKTLLRSSPMSQFWPLVVMSRTRRMASISPESSFRTLTSLRTTCW